MKVHLSLTNGIFSSEWVFFFNVVIVHYKSNINPQNFLQISIHVIIMKSVYPIPCIQGCLLSASVFYIHYKFTYSADSQICSFVILTSV